MSAAKQSWEEQRKAYELRELRCWADMEVGMEYEPFILHITKEMVESIMEVTGDRNPLYWDEEEAGKSAYGGTIAPQATAVIYGRLAYLGDTHRPVPGGIVTSLSFQFIKPPMVGDIITSRAKIVGKEERKGRKYFELRAESFNQHNDLISVMEQTAILPK